MSTEQTPAPDNFLAYFRPGEYATIISFIEKGAADTAIFMLNEIATREERCLHLISHEHREGVAVYPLFGQEAPHPVRVIGDNWDGAHQREDYIPNLHLDLRDLPRSADYAVKPGHCPKCLKAFPAGEPKGCPDCELCANCCPERAERAARAGRGEDTADDPRRAEAARYNDEYTIRAAFTRPPSDSPDDELIKSLAAEIQRGYDEGGLAGFFEVCAVRRADTGVVLEVRFDRYFTDDLDVVLENYPGAALVDALGRQLDAELREAAEGGHISTPFAVGLAEVTLAAPMPPALVNYFRALIQEECALCAKPTTLGAAREAWGRTQNHTLLGLCGPGTTLADFRPCAAFHDHLITAHGEDTPLADIITKYDPLGPALAAPGEESAA